MPKEIIPFDEWYQTYSKQYPQSTRQEALSDYSHLVSQETGKSFTQVVREEMAAIGNNLRQGIAEAGWSVGPGITKALGALTPGSEQDPAGGGVRARLGKLAGLPFGLAGEVVSRMVPTNPEEAVMMAAAGPVAKLPGLARIPAMAGIGAASSALTGGEPAAGAVTGALAQTGGELVRGGVTLLQNRRTASKLVKEGIERAQGFKSGLESEAPALFTETPGLTPSKDPVQHLYWLRGRKGQEVLSQSMKNADGMIVETMGENRIRLPVVEELMGMSDPTRGAILFTPQEALTALKLATSGRGHAIRIPDGPNKEALEAIARGPGSLNAPAGYDGNFTRQFQAALKEQFLNQVASQNPAVAQAYEAALKNYATGVAWRTALRKSGSFGEKGTGPKSSEGASFDPDQMRQYIKMNPDKVGEDIYPAAWAGLSGNALPGASTVTGRVPLPFLRIGRHGLGAGERSTGITYTRGKVGEGPFPIALPTIATIISGNYVAE